MKRKTLQHYFEASKVYIRVNLELLETTLASTYLGRTFDLNNSNKLDLYGNLRKVNQQWGVVAKVATNMVTKV